VVENRESSVDQKYRCLQELKCIFSEIIYLNILNEASKKNTFIK